MTKPAHILIVDDESLNRTLLKTALENEGYMVATAVDAQSALDQLQQQTFELILLDIFLPDMFGDQLLEQLKAHEEWQAIPVTIISATEQMDIERYLELGAVNFLPKPFRAEQIYHTVQAALSNSSSTHLDNK